MEINLTNINCFENVTRPECYLNYLNRSSITTVRPNYLLAGLLAFVWLIIVVLVIYQYFKMRKKVERKDKEQTVLHTGLSSLCSDTSDVKQGSEGKK